MKYLTIVLMLVPMIVFSSNVAIYDTVNSPNRVKSYARSVNTQFFLDRNDVIIFTETNSHLDPRFTGLFPAVPIRYWIVIGDTAIVEMTQTQKDSIDLEEAQADTNNTRQAAKGGFDGFNADALRLKAAFDITKDEINILRLWTRDFKTIVANANNLGDIKTGVAGLPTLNDRTLAQLKTAIKNRIDSGLVDTTAFAPSKSWWCTRKFMIVGIPVTLLTGFTIGLIL